MLPLLLVLLAPPADPGWRFIDELAADGRAAAVFRTVELAAAPTSPLHTDDKPPAGSVYGSAGVGPGGRSRINIVWHAATNALWLDADGDGRFGPAERHALGAKPLEALIDVPGEGAEPLRRTLLVRQRGVGVAWAVRGYAEGSVTVAGRRVRARLTDGDADGRFDGAGSDRVWLDLDGDGAFDPLAEQFALGGAIQVGGAAVLVKPRADGLGLVVRERPSEMGALAVEVARMPGSEVVELSATYVSEFGELVAVKSEGEPAALPAGRYRVEGVRLRLSDGAGKVWTYTFSSGDHSAFPVEVVRGRTTGQRLLADLKASVGLAGGARAVPGAAVRVQPDVTAGGLYLVNCEVGTRHDDGYGGRGPAASIILSAPGSEVLDRCESGFN